MSSVLPSIGGVDINGLIYRYTTEKETDADMKVTVGNLNFGGDGYLFKETDDWSGVPSNTITFVHSTYFVLSFKTRKHFIMIFE